MSPIRRTVSLITSPLAAFSDLMERPTWWFPFAVAVVGTVIIQLWYFQLVDYAWLADYAVSMNQRAAQLPEASRAAIAAQMPKSRLLMITLVLAVLTPVVLRTLTATFFNLLGKVLNIRKTFQDWLALVWWAALPLSITLVADALLLIFTHTRQLSPPALSVFSLNELFFHEAYRDRGFNILQTLTVLHPIAWWLTVRGVQALSGRSLGFSAAFTLGPILLLYGVWSLLPFA